MSLKRPAKIIADNPGLAKFWTVQDIGYLLRLGLVAGEKLNGGRSGCLVEENHVLKLHRLVIAKSAG